MCVRSEGLPTKKGCGSATAPSPSASGSEGSPRGLVGSFSLDSMAVSWDDSPTIRDRIRENHNLMMRYDDTLRKPVADGYIDATIDNIKLNAMVLTPLLVVMKDNNHQLPSIEALNKAIDAFYQLSKVARSTDLVYQESWALRRLIGRLKKFIYRPFPPQDCCDLKTKYISTIILILYLITSRVYSIGETTYNKKHGIDDTPAGVL